MNYLQHNHKYNRLPPGGR